MQNCNQSLDLTIGDARSQKNSSTTDNNLHDRKINITKKKTWEPNKKYSSKFKLIVLGSLYHKTRRIHWVKVHQLCKWGMHNPTVSNGSNTRIIGRLIYFKMAKLLLNAKRNGVSCSYLLIAEGDKAITSGASSFIVPHDSSITDHKWHKWTTEKLQKSRSGNKGGNNFQNVSC
jgi:hypothetical protein